VTTAEQLEIDLPLAPFGAGVYVLEMAVEGTSGTAHAYVAVKIGS
jgi:hypothetical protein